jgi:hypothetical protein
MTRYRFGLVHTRRKLWSILGLQMGRNRELPGS